ncbi:MAG: lipid biosynthesis B12-binding/radical SAM protein [bacterium]
MKILLISSNSATTPYPVYPLGLSQIAAALRKAGHEVCQFDYLQQGQSLDALADTIHSFRPALIGISIRNIDNVNFLHEQKYIGVVKNIVQSIRQHTSVPVVLGGSGFSILPEEILAESGADYGIVGEGESALVDFVDRLAQGDYSDPASGRIEDRLIRPAASLMGVEISSAGYDPDLMKFYLQNGGMAAVQTKRGCSQRCTYCSYPFLEGSIIRCRDPQAVVDDIQMLMDEYGVHYIFFTDSVFNDTQKHHLPIIREMEKRRLCVPWTAFFTPAGLDDEEVALMKKTGLKAAEIGADAPSDIPLRKLGKSFLFKDIAACNDLFARHDVATAHYFMFGCPGETKETVAEGIENIRGLKRTVSFIFMGIRVLPHTALFETACREGMLEPEQKLLDPVYYISPAVEKTWLEETLASAFSGDRYCIYPPDSLDSNVQLLHQMGYVGSLWDMLLSSKDRRSRKRQ